MPMAHLRLFSALLRPAWGRAFFVVTACFAAVAGSMASAGCGDDDDATDTGSTQTETESSDTGPGIDTGTDTDTGTGTDTGSETDTGTGTETTDGTGTGIDTGTDTGTDTGSDTGPTTFDGFRGRGPYDPGHATVTVTDPKRRGVSLTFEVWYPANPPGPNEGIRFTSPAINFVPAEFKDELTPLLDAAPATCTRIALGASPGAPVADKTPDGTTPAPFPVLIGSHCLECMRWSLAEIAEALATHGFVVAIPDHTRNTFYDFLAKTSDGLSQKALDNRVADIKLVLDTLTAAGQRALPEGLRGRLDTGNIGMFGHSFGAVTTGRMLQDDDRLNRGIGLASPFENPLFTTKMSRIAEPAFFLVAVEDNSIQEIGNGFIRKNYDAAQSGSAKIEVADAGHWSFSDINGLTEKFQPGCGTAKRQTNPAQSVTYIDAQQGRTIAAAAVTAFFKRGAAVFSSGWEGPGTLDIKTK
jgi:dienelactone hydrolase